MLVESVAVKNFKGLGDFAVEGLRRVTLLGGKNGCGKTTLLEALFMCFHRNWNSGHHPILFPLRIDSAVNEDALAHLFHDGKIDAPITMSCVADGVSHSVKIEYAHESGSGEISVPFSDISKSNGGAPLSTRAAHRMSVEYLENDKWIVRADVTLKTDRMHIQMDEAPASGRIFVQIVTDGLVRTGLDEDADNLSELTDKGEKGVILEALKIIAPQATEVEVLSVRKTPLVHVRIGNAKRMLPSALLGAGAQKALSFALALHSNENGLFLLDEITVGWHHSLLVDLWRMIFRACKERNNQVIATTHSDEGLTAFTEAAALEKCKDDACYVRLERQGGMKVLPKVFKYETLAASREIPLEVR